MLFTLYYAYATIMQWWRLSTLRNKLNGTLTAQNALLMCSAQHMHDSRNLRSLENLLFRTEDRIACTVVPKQKLNLNSWISFPKNMRYFPIYILPKKFLFQDETVFVLLQTVLENYVKHQSEIIQVENFGELIGWKASDCFEVVLKTDLCHLTYLINQFAQNDIDINHELKLLKIETVDVKGAPTIIKYDRKYLKEQTLKYSYAPAQWKNFVTDVRDLYSKIRDITNPKIKIENGSPKYVDKSKSEKLTKKDSKKNLEVKKEPKGLDVRKEGKKSDDKNTLEVTLNTDHRRHKPSKADKKTKDTSSQTNLESKSKHKTSSEKRKGKEQSATTSKLHVKKEHRNVTNKLAKQSSVRASEIEVKSSDTTKGDIERENEICGNFFDVKPPNVLVYADSQVTKDNVKKVLYLILNKEKYTIYDLPISSKQNIWNKSTVLVVVCGTVPPELTSNLISYFLNGGQLLCLCSDLMYSVLHTFTTAEVREHELVRFSYGSWEHVEMMHHIFCYQASPAKKQFSKDFDNQSSHSSNGCSPLASRTLSNVELRHNEKNYNIQVEILGTEETWQTPSLLLAKVKTSIGRSVFSQVHLEIDPDEYENDKGKYQSLLNSNEARLNILKDILSTHFDLTCDTNFNANLEESVEYSPAYFLGTYDAKMAMLSNSEDISQNQLICENIYLVFCGHNVQPGIASHFRLPVLMHSCPTNFSTLDYFETLQTEDVGRLVLYADVLTSSQHLLSKKLSHGLVVIPRQQTEGMGRSKNRWLSPIGCAAFSLQMHIPLNSNMGMHVSMIQHLVMVAVVSAIKKLKGCEELSIGIKWPNDLYADCSAKIGGLLVNSTLTYNLAIVNIGCGINLSNQNPTICINELIDRMNKKNKSAVPTISYEKYFAVVFNELERLYKNVQKDGFDEVMNLYYRYWLHSDAHITIQNAEGESKRARIVGIDEFGFLSVILSDGTETTVQHDGNSFDMLAGLIAPKKF